MARTPTPVRTEDGERRLRYGWVWIVFLALTFVGAGMLLSPDATTRAWGLVVLLAPLAGVGLLLLAFYLKTRSDADAPPPGTR